MQSIEEHQTIHKGESVAMPVGGRRKWHRVRNLAEERGQKMRKRTRGNSGSRRTLAATCRKVSRRAKVTWQEINLIRIIRILEQCGRRKEIAADGIWTTRCAKVARHKGRVVNNCTYNWQVQQIELSYPEPTSYSRDNICLYIKKLLQISALLGHPQATHY
jgi:hypothetical protein